MKSRFSSILSKKSLQASSTGFKDPKNDISRQASSSNSNSKKSNSELMEMYKNMPNRYHWLKGCLKKFTFIKSNKYFGRSGSSHGYIEELEKCQCKERISVKNQ